MQVVAMAIRGRRPKDEDQRVNRNALTHDWIEVPDVPFRGDRPGLPPGMPAQTYDWWETVSTMPLCVLWREGDWHFALGSPAPPLHIRDSPGQRRSASRGPARGHLCRAGGHGPLTPSGELSPSRCSPNNALSDEVR